MIQEDKLSDQELGIIWEATKKGDLEGKLTILKTLKEIFKRLKEKHLKVISEQLYNTPPNELTNEEIDVKF